MPSRINVELAQAFLQELTGIQFGKPRFDLTSWASFDLPPRENVAEVRVAIESKFGTQPVFKFNALLGADIWSWDLGRNRSLALYHYKRDRARADTKNVIRMFDERPNTGYYGVLR